METSVSWNNRCLCGLAMRCSDWYLPARTVFFNLLFMPTHIFLTLKDKNKITRHNVSRKSSKTKLCSLYLKHEDSDSQTVLDVNKNKNKKHFKIKLSIPCEAWACLNEHRADILAGVKGRRPQSSFWAALSLSLFLAHVSVRFERLTSHRRVVKKQKQFQNSFVLKLGNSLAVAKQKKSIHHLMLSYMGPWSSVGRLKKNTMSSSPQLWPFQNNHVPHVVARVAPLKGIHLFYPYL